MTPSLPFLATSSSISWSSLAVVFLRPLVRRLAKRRMFCRRMRSASAFSSAAFLARSASTSAMSSFLSTVAWVDAGVMSFLC